MMSSAPDSLAAARLLLRAAEVLLTCADSVTRIEAQIIPLLDHAIGAPERKALQEIDLLGQRLVDISACLSQIASAQMRNDPFDEREVLAPLRLHDLRTLLTGQEPEKRNPRDDFALF